MSFDKKGPYVLIILLVIILIFILGVQYGKRVKVADTAIAFLLSISPSPTAKPAQMPVIKYNSYSHVGCQVKFLYPSYLKLDSESSEEAKFITDGKKQFIKINCLTKLAKSAESTNSASISINGFQGTATYSKMNINNENIDATRILINRSSLPVEFIMNKELEPLITTSIDFE